MAVVEGSQLEDASLDQDATEIADPNQMAAASQRPTVTAPVPTNPSQGPETTDGDRVKFLADLGLDLVDDDDEGEYASATIATDYEAIED